MNVYRYRAQKKAGKKDVQLSEILVRFVRTKTELMHASSTSQPYPSGLFVGLKVSPLRTVCIRYVVKQFTSTFEKSTCEDVSQYCRMKEGEDGKSVR